MAKRKKNKKNKRLRAVKRFFTSRFFIIYAAIVVLCVVGLFVGGNRLRQLCADYEATRPIFVAEDFFKHFEDRDFGTLHDMDTNAQGVGEGDKDFYVQTMDELTQGGSFAMKERYTSSADEKIYRVQMNGEPFAEFHLSQTDEKTATGMKYWAVDSVTSYVSAEKYVEQEPVEQQPEVIQVVNVTVTAPETYAVSVNGEKMTSKQIAETLSAYPTKGFLPKGVPETKLNRYVCQLNTTDISVEVTDPEGKPVELTQENEFTWSCTVPTDEGVEQYEDRIKEVAGQITRFTSRGIKKDKMKSYCVGGSPAWQIFNDFNQNVTLVHKSADFADWKIDSFRKHGDNCFTCHISFLYTRHFAKVPDKVYDISYTMCFGVKGKLVQLYNIDFNSTVS